MVLSLVEPQSSGIGGGGFLLYYDATTGAIDAYDGRETAPAGGDARTCSSAPTASRCPSTTRWSAGSRSACPVVRPAASSPTSDHGKLPWATLFQPAIASRSDGFPCRRGCISLIAEDRYLKTDSAAAAAYFYADGPASRKPVEPTLRNPALRRHPAATRRRRRRRLLSRRPIARDDRGRRARRRAAGPARRGRPRALSARKRGGLPDPIGAGWSAACRRRPRAASRCCRSWACSSRSTWRHWRRTRAAAVHLVAEAEPARLRRPRPLSGRSRLRRRAGRRAAGARLSAPPRRAISPCATCGMPRRATPGGHRLCRRRHLQEPVTTSHLSIVDGAGNAVELHHHASRTPSARDMLVDGFLLNNQLTDFSLRGPSDDGQAGRQPRRAGQAAAQLDVADPGVRPRRPARAERRLARRRARSSHFVAKAMIAAARLEAFGIQQALGAAAISSTATARPRSRTARRSRRISAGAEGARPRGASRAGTRAGCGGSWRRPTGWSAAPTRGARAWRSAIELGLEQVAERPVARRAEDRRRSLPAIPGSSPTRSLMDAAAKALPRRHARHPARRRDGRRSVSSRFNPHSLIAARPSAVDPDAGIDALLLRAAARAGAGAARPLGRRAVLPVDPCRGRRAARARRRPLWRGVGRADQHGGHGAAARRFCSRPWTRSLRRRPSC